MKSAKGASMTKVASRLRDASFWFQRQMLERGDDGRVRWKGSPLPTWEETRAQLPKPVPDLAWARLQHRLSDILDFSAPEVAAGKIADAFFEFGEEMGWTK